MLSKPTSSIAGVAAIEAAGAVTLEYIYPKFHDKKGQDILAYDILAPRDRLELPTKWLTATRSTN